MNRCVPDFEMDDDYSIPTSSAPNLPPRKPTMPEDDIMELLWQNGQIVVQSQNHRSTLDHKKSKDDAVLPDDGDSNRPTASQPQPGPQNQHLFIQEDEMANWLHYPIVDDPFCGSELLYPDFSTINHGNNTATTAELRKLQISAPAPKPPIHPPSTELQNFHHFSRNNNRHRVADTAPSSSKSVVTETMTVVDSCESPLVGPSSRVLNSRIDSGGGLASATTSFTTCATGTTSFATGATATASFLAKEVIACDMSLTSSPGGSSASVSAEPMSVQKPPTGEDRKRKRREAEDDVGFQSEDVELEYAKGKKQACGSTSAKRSRAAEVHNLSERRRRDRINEKMKALQELIPRCNKSDKASMLDEAIEYLKSLQLQVQMMSMGCGMVPMMYPGVPPYMPMGMGMGMGMEMPGMNRPMMPYPNVFAGSTMPPAAAAHLGPRFPIQQFHMQPVPGNDPTRAQAANQPDPMLNRVGAQNLNQSRIPNFADPYQQYYRAQQMQLSLQQNQSMAQSRTGNKPSSSRVPETHENYQ